MSHHIAPDRPEPATLVDPFLDSSSRVDGHGVSMAATAALWIMIGSVLSRLLGLAREQLAAGYFGTGDAMAAFTVADNVHTLFFDLAVSGMLQAALIPVLTRWSPPGAGGRDELRRIAGTLVVLVMLITGALALIGAIFAPTVVRGMTALLGPTESHGPETIALTITLVRWLLPAVVLLAVGTVLMAVLYALNLVAAPAVSLALRNAAIVGAIILFAGPLGVRSMALGIVTGAGLIVVALIGPLHRAGALPRPNISFGHPAVREIGRLYAPIFLGLLVSTAAVVIDRNLSWGAGTNALGAMRYATTLVQLVLGLVAAAISLAALPTLSRHHAANDTAAFRATLGRALSMTTVLILPATFGLAAVAMPTVDVLFGHGAMSVAGERAIVVALLGYLPGTLFAAYDQVLIFAFYARTDTRTPVLVGLLAVGVYLVVAFSLVNALGMLGLVLANSAQFTVHALVMIWCANRRFGPMRNLLVTPSAISCLYGALAASAVAFTFWIGLDQTWSSRTGPIDVIREMTVAGLPIAVGGLVYLGILHRRQVQELDDLRRATLGRAWPRFANGSPVRR